MKLFRGIIPILLSLVVADRGLVQGQEKKATTQVSGTVTFDGKPVTAGRVIFHSGKGGMRDTIVVEIAEDGKYVARKLKPADGVKVTIDVECIEVLAKQLAQRLMDLESRARLIKLAKKEDADLDKQITDMKERMKRIEQARKKLVKVPAKYTAVETTPLSVNVTEGEQTINLELKD
jgi:hypothetical protein